MHLFAHVMQAMMELLSLRKTILSGNLSQVMIVYIIISKYAFQPNVVDTGHPSTGTVA